jgi:non-heme chloroperoxidase
VHFADARLATGPRLHRISAPTLLIWGARDALFARDEQDRLMAALPHAALKVYAETGHCPNWERPEQVAADLTAFMQST